MADRLLPCLKAGGRYMTYGIDDAGKIRIDPSRARGEFTVMPCSCDEAETHQRISEWVLQGRLDACLWYDMAKPYPLASLADAFAAVWNRQCVKALVTLRGK
jgi:hypothetical protein